MHLNGGKLLKYHLKGKTYRKEGNGLKIFKDSEKSLDPRGWSAPTSGQYTRIYRFIMFSVLRFIKDSHRFDYNKTVCFASIFD